MIAEGEVWFEYTHHLKYGLLNLLHLLTFALTFVTMHLALPNLSSYFLSFTSTEPPLLAVHIMAPI